MSRNLQVVGITTSGQIKHCFRKASNGRWQAFFGDIEQSVVKKEISKFVEVSCRPANNDLVDIIAIDNLGKCYRFRQDSLKQWFGTDLPIIDNLNIKKVSKTDFTNTCYLFLLHDTQVKQGNLAILSKNHGASTPFGNISTTFNTSNLPELTDISVSKLESNVVRNTGNEKSFVVAANAAGDVNIK